MFCDTLEDISLIVPHLYLGNIKVAASASRLKDKDIKHVMSIVGPKDEITQQQKVPGISYRHYSRLDQANEDLLTVIPECVELIRNVISFKKESILVHCMVGASRSATIVIAYMMISNRWPMDTALNFVKSRRPIVNPNIGFRYQLRLFERMQCRLNIVNKEFRLYLLNTFGFNQYPDNLVLHINVFFHRVNEYEQAEKKILFSYNFKCAKCSNQLFTDLNVLQSPPSISETGSGTNPQQPKTIGSSIGESACKYYLIEPIYWIVMKTSIFSNYLSNNGGAINCYSCGTQLGRFTFYPFQTAICNCDEHRTLISYLTLAIYKDAVRRKSTNRKGFFAGLFSTH